MDGLPAEKRPLSQLSLLQALSALLSQPSWLQPQGVELQRARGLCCSCGQSGLHSRYCDACGVPGWLVGGCGTEGWGVKGVSVCGHLAKLDSSIKLSQGDSLYRLQIDSTVTLSGVDGLKRLLSWQK